MKNKKIILFDGVCNLCNSTVNFIIDKDKNDEFRFAALQSEVGNELQKKFSINPENLNSVILIDEKKVYFQSEAVLRITQELGYPIRFLNWFSFLPTKLKDSVYNLVAHNRYKIFGKKETCLLPSPELEKKFLL
jgi:predicted DCC family thiol-disulfide oxidoreductase YuxK